MVFSLLERDLTIDDVINYGRNRKEILYLSRDISRENSDVGREFMEKLLSDFKSTVKIYGVTHAYGHRVGEEISAEQRLSLPENLINSMVIGIGADLPMEWSRGFNIARIS